MNSDFECENGILKNYNGNETVVFVPDNVEIIGENAFKAKTHIEKIILPETITSIKNNAFKGCRKLIEINFPNTLKEIGDYAFHRCHSLKTVILSDNTVKLGKCVFLYCDGLEKVCIKGVKKLENQSFANNTNLREIWLNKDLDISNIKDDILTGCTKINRIGLSDGNVFDVENMIDIIDSKSANRIVKAVAESIYNSMKIENKSLYKFCVNLKEVEIPEGIVCIEKSCFFDKKGIISITLPKSIERIKDNAFGNCINLEKIILQNENIIIDEKAFKGCCNLTNVTLCNGKVYNLKKFIFDEDVPHIVKKISEQVRGDFYISGLTLMAYRGKEERVTVPDGIKIIAESCFEGNAAIGKVILPNSVEQIWENAFKNCVSLQRIDLSENLNIIEKGAFENCVKLLDMVLPENTEVIGESAFKRCVKLNSFYINKSLKEINDMAFYGCKQLKTLDIPNDTKLNGNMIFFDSGIRRNETEIIEEKTYSQNDIKPYEFCGNENIDQINITEPCIIGKYAFSGCKNINTVYIQNTECVIEEFAFEKCQNIKNVFLNVKSIGKCAFAFCKNIENIYVSGTDFIGEKAFFGCENLKKAEFSDSVKMLGKSCFEECTGLENFAFKNIDVIGERAFARCENIKKIRLDSIKVCRYAFEDCFGVKSIEVTENTVIKSRAFFSCTNADEVIYKNTVYKFDLFKQSINCVSNVFPQKVQEVIASIYSCFKVNEKYELLSYLGNSKSIKIPNDIISLENEAFRNCLRLNNIDFPKSIKYIGRLTFAGTGWLEKTSRENKITVINNIIVNASKCGESAEIPEYIKRVCSWSFAGNYDIKQIKICSEKTIIDEYAFRNCINLKKIIMPDNKVYTLNDVSVRENTELPNIVRQIFTDCINCFKTDKNGKLIESTGNIKNIVFINGIKKISANVYKDCHILESIVLSDDTECIENNAFENSKWLRELKNGRSVKTIGSFAFSGCQNLETVEFSENLQYIGKRCFEHCSKLKSIIIPEGIEEIYERTFFRCKNLKEVVLPASLKIIRKEAFAFCENLENVIFLGKPDIEEGAFKWCPTDGVII